MEINRVARELAGIERPKRNGAPSGPEAASARGRDQVELSTAAKAFADGQAIGVEGSVARDEIRDERVREVRDRIDSGYYENNREVRDVVLARLVESVLNLGEQD